jgi:beta-xylosidase
MGSYHILKHIKDTPLKQCYTLTERPGHLRLYGNCYDLASPEAPAMLLRKQTSYTESLEVQMQFSPRKVGYEAGIVLWWSQYSYATYGLTLYKRLDGKPALMMACRVPSGKAGEVSVCLHHFSLVAHRSMRTC